MFCHVKWEKGRLNVDVKILIQDKDGSLCNLLDNGQVISKSDEC